MFNLPYVDGFARDLGGYLRVASSRIFIRVAIISIIKHYKPINNGERVSAAKRAPERLGVITEDELFHVERITRCIIPGVLHKFD